MSNCYSVVPALQDRNTRTPHLASGARRIPVGKKGGYAEEGDAADAPTPQTSDKTPTLCLFQRFESLTLNTPATATAAKPAMRCSASAAGPASCSTTSSRNSSQAVCAGQAEAAAGTGAAEPGRQRRSVAFGTPCVLAYTPASPAIGAAQQDTTPLWSNAGHTPYSLNGKDSGGVALCGQSAMPKELKQLLSDPQVAAAALQPSAALGTCDVLSPVRTKKQLQHALGAGDQVLSPVRRSTRKAPKHMLVADSSAVTPMLEATNYCYQGRGGGQEQPFGHSMQISMIRENRHTIASW
ncbi:hypothetical protein COO60DRAFT_1456975 [Scenedesmus sp. NREL 46B-D3]|nr:hypothetical protein COO60DRAFT_1456975 [Scenedesmus sp. NREL 46B-D3]